MASDANFEYHVEFVSPPLPHMAAEIITELIATMQKDGWEYVSQTPFGADLNVTFRRLRPGYDRSVPGAIIIPRRNQASGVRRGCGTSVLIAAVLSATPIALHLVGKRCQH